MAFRICCMEYDTSWKSFDTRYGFLQAGGDHHDHSCELHGLVSKQSHLKDYSFGNQQVYLKMM